MVKMYNYHVLLSGQGFSIHKKSFVSISCPLSSAHSWSHKLHLKLLLSDKDAVVVSAIEVSPSLNDAIVLPVSFIQFNTDPLTRSEPSVANEPDKIDNKHKYYNMSIVFVL